MTLTPARRLPPLGLLLVALLLSGLPPALAPSYAATSARPAGAVVDADSARDVAPTPRVIRFGQVGKAKAGMSVAQGAATGELRKNAPGYCTGSTLPLRPRKPYANQYVVLTVDGRIAEMDVVLGRPRTQYGLRIGSLNEQVKSDYGRALSKPVKAGFGQWARFVSKGTGANRTWIGFLFGQAFVEDGVLTPGDEVTLIGVSKGARPDLILDGC